MISRTRDLACRGSFTNATVDEGESWTDANAVGFQLNRLRVVGSSSRAPHASGDTVGNAQAEPLANLRRATDVVGRLLEGAVESHFAGLGD